MARTRNAIRYNSLQMNGIFIGFGSAVTAPTPTDCTEIMLDSDDDDDGDGGGRLQLTNTAPSPTTLQLCSRACEDYKFKCNTGS